MSYTPAQWRVIAQKAAAAIAKNPDDAEAHKWIGRASAALKAAILPEDQARQALSAAERAEAGKNTGLNALQDQVQAGLLGFSQGSTAGFGDEIASLAGTPTAEGRAVLQSAAANHAPAYYGGDVAGTLGTIGLGPGPVGARALIRPGAGVAERLIARLVGNAGTGAAIGGLEAAGRGEGSLTERLPGIKTGAAVGGAIGATLPVAAAVTKRVTQYGRRFAGDVLENIAGKAAPKTARASEVLTPSAPRTFDDLTIATAVRKGTVPARGSVPIQPTVPDPEPVLGMPALGVKGSRPGKPIWYGEGTTTKSPEVRGGEPLHPITKWVNKPFKVLMESYDKADAYNQAAIVKELQRRHLVIPGLTAP